MEEHSALGLQMVTSSKLVINNGLSPQKASVATLCQILPRQWLDLFRITSSPRKFTECLYCNDGSPPILHVLSCSIESPVTYSLCDRSSHIHAFMHPHIDTFRYSHIHAHTIGTQISFIHNCINHPKSLLLIKVKSFIPRFIGRRNVKHLSPFCRITEYQVYSPVCQITECRKHYSSVCRITEYQVSFPGWSDSGMSKTLFPD